VEVCVCGGVFVFEDLWVRGYVCTWMCVLIEVCVVWSVCLLGLCLRIYVFSRIVFEEVCVRGVVSS